VCRVQFRLKDKTIQMEEIFPTTLLRPTRLAKGKNHQAYLWQYSRPGGPVVFDFQLDRGRQGPRQFLGEFAGILQTDGYAGYGKVGGKDMVHAGCWAHVRRYFFQAVQLNRRTFKPAKAPSIG